MIAINYKNTNGHAFVVESSNGNKTAVHPNVLKKMTSLKSYGIVNKFPGDFLIS